MRITVTGIRGKSTFVRWCEEVLRGRGVRTLAKITGDVDPHWVHDGEVIPIIRPRKTVFLEETLAYRNYEHDVLIAENQGITPYTMHVLNDMVRPDAIVITNVRLDHGDTMGETKERIAESIGGGFTRCRAVVSGETDDKLNKILKRHADRVGAQFIVAERSSELNPLAPLIGLVDATFTGLGLPRLSLKERELLHDQLPPFWCKKGPGTSLWFDGAKINDVDSSEQVLGCLMATYPFLDFSIVAYFRSDRPGRTGQFESWLASKSLVDRMRLILLAGRGGNVLARRIGQDKVRTIDERLSPDRIIETCSGTVMFLAVNAVNNFMQRLKNTLTVACPAGLETDVLLRPDPFSMMSSENTLNVRIPVGKARVLTPT